MVVRLFTLMVMWLTGSYGSLPLPSITREYPTTHRWSREKIKIQSTISSEWVLLLHQWSQKIMSWITVIWGSSVFFTDNICINLPISLLVSSQNCFSSSSPVWVKGTTRCLVPQEKKPFSFSLDYSFSCIHNPI